MCSRCPVGPNGTISLFTWPGRSTGVPCVVCLCSPVVVEPWWLLLCQWVGLTLRLTGCEDCPWLQWISYCVGVDLLSCIHSYRLWCRWFSVVVWSQQLDVLLLGLLGRGSHESKSQPLSVANLGLPGMSHKMIHCWLLPVLNLKLHGRSHTENWGCLPPILSLGQLSKRFRAPWALLLPASCPKAQLLNES